MSVCRNCREVKSVDEFYKFTRGGHDPVCKECRIAIGVARMKKRREAAGVRRYSSESGYSELAARFCSLPRVSV